MPEKTLKVTLLTHTPEPEKVCALAARTCYSALEMEELQSPGFRNRSRANFSSGCSPPAMIPFWSTPPSPSPSRGSAGRCWRSWPVAAHRQLLRSESQRYVSLAEGFGYIVPPRIAALGPQARAEFEGQMAQMQAWYAAWQEKLGAGEGAPARTRVFRAAQRL